MKIPTKRLLIPSLIGVMILLQSCLGFASAEPLPSWNDTLPKKRIMSFVEDVTREGSGKYLPVSERIAVFDNDGTLWAEKPLYFQAFFIFDRIKELSPQHPEWKTTEPFSSVLKGDIAKALEGGTEALMQLTMKTHSGMTTEEFEQIAHNWIQHSTHPETGKKYTAMVYQPMLELLDYLRANGFTTYIVSGGGIEFMRPWTQAVYGIPPQQVIGSSMKTAYEVKNGTPVISRLPELNFINDKEGKPLGIHYHIGRRPVMAFGNSDGDFQMLEWVTSRPGPSFGMLIHHTDGDREYAYDRDSHVGRLARGLDEADSRNWVVTSMKDDWKMIYPQ